MAWKPIKEYPKKDGAYRVRMKDGTEQKAWFITRKELWVTMDGSEALSARIKEWRTRRLQKPEWESCRTKKVSA